MNFLNDLYSFIDEKIDCLIFDLDGTIADTMPLHIEAWIEMGNKYGAQLTADMINTYAGSPTSKVIQILNEEYGWQMEVEEGAAHKSELFSSKLDQVDRIHPLEPIWEIAERYKGIKPLCIGTGSGRANAHKTIRLLGAEGFFDYVVTATDVQNHKPHPETFLLSAHQFNVAPNRCLVFEDGQLGIDAALNAGMHALFYPSFELISAK
jgi:beta-phosphoglucomutase family hydrolase